MNEGIQHYEHEQPGLGAAFLAEVRRCTAAIVNQSDAGHTILGAVRRRLCHRFPYALLYTRTDEEIRVLAVMNLRRQSKLLGSVAPKQFR